MPHAGFYAVESRRIRFGRDGRWYSDDEPIENARIARLFSRCIRRDPDGGYMLQVGDERAHIEVDDTPFVVERLDGDPERGFRIVLNDETSEELDLESIDVAPDGAVVCRVKDGEYDARFLRSAHYDLARHVVAEPGDGYVLRSGPRTVRLSARGG